jgi:hypothetical protein
MREIILARIEVIRNTFGEDRFGERYEKGKKKGQLKSGLWAKDEDFSKLSDQELAEVFEKIVFKSYQQR